MSFFNKSIRIFRLLEDHIMWPVYWFFITMGVTISTLVNPNFSRTTIGYMLPKFSSTILSVTTIFLLFLLIFEFRQRPKPSERKFIKMLLAPLELIWMPVVGFFFGALPGLDAHTRLMLGRYLEYRVTEKIA